MTMPFLQLLAFIIVPIAIILLIISIILLNFNHSEIIMGLSIFQVIISSIVLMFGIPLSISGLIAFEEREEFRIYSLERDNVTNGNFVLGTGSIDSKVYYTVLIKPDPERERYIFKQFDAKKTFIEEFPIDSEFYPRYTTEKIRFELYTINTLYIPEETIINGF